MQRLVLFDIDNTLLSLNQGNLPQRQALNSAFAEVHGITDVFDDVAFTGGMDLPLMVEVYRKYGLTAVGSDGLPDMTGFKTAYFRQLASNLEAWSEGMVCPGVPELLTTLASTPGVQLGLETGNFREAAFIKLRRYGLDGYFEDGGFGGDHMERRQVVASAVAACETRAGRIYRPQEVLVVGDSPADIEAGNANGAMTLAVATGSHTAEHLAEFSPTYVMRDLSDTQTARDLLLSA